MYKLCKTEQSAARQRQLELGLLEAMMVRPYDEISISDLCEQLKIPRKSFYRYFSNKDGALMALLDHTLMEFVQLPLPLSEKKQGSPVADLERFFLFWYQQRQLLEALMRSRLSGMLVERATDHAIHERMMPAYLVNADRKSQRLALTFAISGLLAIVMQWHREDFASTPFQMAQVATMMLTQPLISDWNRS